MKQTLSKRLICFILTLVMVAGIIPVTTVTVSADETGKSVSNPILISTMDQLIEEMEKDTEGETYYKLTEDISHETSIEYMDGREDHTGDDGYNTVRKPQMAQCVVGTGKKFLELDGYDIHYKNNVNFNLGDDHSKYWGSGPKYDSLTFFYLGEGCDLTVSNTTGNDAKVWYDGWMHNRTNFFGGPNYIYTAVRDVFRVESGAELTVNNTDIKAGRNRKIWMVHSFYLDKDKETNLLVKLTYNGYAYEQIYGSAIVANGGKVTINGGYIEGRGGYRDEYNVSGVPDWKKDSIADMFWGGDFTTDDIMENCLSNVGAKAAVQIAGEGSTVIINDGEFWGYGGANVIGINKLNDGSVKEYTLRINAGTFDTSKTDKERVPDRNAGSVNNGPWPFSASNWMLWANCRCIRDTLRGNIGIPAVDGYGKNVFNTKMVHVYIDEEEEEDEVIDNADLDFRRKSDSDTIIVKPREEKAYWNTEPPIWSNYADRSNYEIYAYSGGKIVAQSSGSGVLYHGPAETPTFYFSAVSHYDMTDEDNPYFDRAHRAICNWVLYEEDKNGNLINSYERVSAPFHTEHKDGHTVYNFKIPLSYFPRYSAVEWNEDNKYYMVAYMEERLDSIVHSYVTKSYITGVFQDWENGIYDGDGVLDYYYSMGLNIDYDPDYVSSFATSGAEVVYSNAVYGSNPELTFNSNYSKLKGSKMFQWQVKEGDEWVDYGNWRITPEAAAEVLFRHDGVVGRTMRLKITSYDGIYDDALYSNACVVQPQKNTGLPGVGNVTWYDDPNNIGRYIASVDNNYGTQEFLIYPHANSRDLSTLNWDIAVEVPVFDNLEMGYYDIYTRYKATPNYTAGTEIVRRKTVIGPYTLTTGFEICQNDKPVDEIIVEVGKEFRLVANPLPADATDKSIINRTAWSPESDKTDMISASWLGEYQNFENNYHGKSIWLKGNKTGTVNVTAIITLDDGTNVSHKVAIHFVPVGYVPFVASVYNNGAEVAIGDSIIPIIRPHVRKEALLGDKRFETDVELTSGIKNLIQNQINASKLMWNLVDGRITMVDRNTVTNGKANLNVNSGKLTINKTAKPGDIIRVVGYIDDPYIGRIEVPGYFTVVAAPEVEVHNHDYADYLTNNDLTHYRVCECGDKITENHSFTQYTVSAADELADAVYGYICSCGYSYMESEDGTRRVHTHALEYAYDTESHWQICADEYCPESYETAKKSHSWVSVGKNSSGIEMFSCSVCGCINGFEYNISGTVVSSGSETDAITISLTRQGETEALQQITVKGKNTEYLIEGVTVGTYTMKVTKKGHVTAQYTVNVSTKAVVQNIRLLLIGEVITGDLNTDGFVDRSDAIQLLYYSIFGEDAYPINQNCDFNGDNVVDRKDAIYLLYHSIFGADSYPLG